MAEMTYARYHHGDAMFIRCGKHFFIAHRACRVDNRFDALRGDHVHAVAEGEECVRSGTRAV